MDEEMITKGPTTGLEQKIDALAAEVRAGFNHVDQRLTAVDERLIGVDERLARVDERLARVDECLTGVGERLTGVEGRLTDVEKKLSDVHDLAQTTNDFGKNVYDKLTSLETKMEDGFRDAKKHQDDQFHDVHAAIHRWGERVVKLEKARTPRPTKRRR